MSFYETEFAALNNSGVMGRVLALVNEKESTITFHIEAMGLEPGQTHIAHVHGFPDDRDAMTPGLAQDTDGDGFVELAEGLATYGPIQMNLTSRPDDPAQVMGMGASFQEVGPDGRLSYNQTFRFADLGMTGKEVLDAILPLEAKEVVLHGQSLAAGQGDGTGEADGTAGYKLVLPVASGELSHVMGAEGVVEAIGEMGLYEAGAIDWDAVAAAYAANPPATSSWFV
jgi:hypothetical protein